MKKLLTAASVAALAFGAANAVDLTNATTGAVNGVYPLATQANDVTGTLSIDVAPTGGGSFPTGNVLVFVNVTNATFSSALNGTELTGATTSVLSTGGASGSSAVNFLITGADNCSPCSIDLPVEIGDTGSVVATVALETDAGAPVQGTTEESPKSVTLVTRANAFDIDIVADTTGDTSGDLDAVTGPFTQFNTEPTPGLVGTIEVTANQVDTDANGIPDTVVNVDLGDTDVSSADLASIDVTVTGNFDPFDTTSTPAGDFAIGGSSFTVGTVNTSEATVSLAGTIPFGPANVIATPDTATAIQRSAYGVTVVAVAGGADLDEDQTATGSLESIGRDGTSVVFPWTASATQSADSGSTNLIRIGNVGASDTGAVFAAALSATEAGISSSAVQIAPSVAAGGELLISGSDLESALGNWGRGDIEITVEEDSASLTARRFIVRDSGIQSLDNGTVADNN